MLGGVHGDAAHHAAGWVAETVGHPGLGAVVGGDGERHDDEFEDDQGEFEGHGDSLREGWRPEFVLSVQCAGQDRFRG